MSQIVTKNIVFRGRNLSLKYPTVGQMIDIKVIEQQLSRGTFRDLLLGTGEDIDVYIYIRTFSHIKVLLPELIGDLKVDSLLDLSIDDYQELVDLYSNEIQPWLQNWQQSLREKMKAQNSGTDKK